MIYHLIFRTPTGQRIDVDIPAATESQAEYAAQRIVPQGSAIEDIDLPQAA